MDRSLVDDIKPKKKCRIKSDQDQDQAQTFKVKVNEIRQRLLNMYPIGYVPRNMIDKATGGIVQSQTAANLDSAGEGIHGGVLIGKKMCYPVDSVIEYILGKMKKAS